MARPDSGAAIGPTAAPIAIIGIGCRFPGARGPAAFWQLLRGGVDAITEVPPERFDLDRFYDPRPKVPGKINTRWGGFLPDVDRFDPYFFGISPREAIGMDPQQRLLLEVAWEAVEDAGLLIEHLAGTRTGVYVGMCTGDYEHLIPDASSMDIYLAAGNARAVIAGRISYALGLEGPSLVTDTACSSSLVALHLACQALGAGECDVALAGGVNLVLKPEGSVGFCQAQMLSPDGRCKAFDARANGFVRSDGIGVVVLKPLARALADGDPVYAVIRGTATNNDGRSGGLLMTPSRAGQEACLREAYRRAGVSPAAVQYVEAHGTGTTAGDPVEAQALGAVLAAGRPLGGPCLIGSVKSNIGHTEGAAGIAGIIKTALALSHREIPASLHVQELNPEIPWAELRLVVQRELTPWPAGKGPALAGVSAFGISGTNAHAVLEAAPVAAARHAAKPATSAPAAADVPAAPAEVLVLSAKDRETLDAVASAHAAHLRGLAPGGSAPAAELRDVCHTASVRRAHHDHRLAVVAASAGEMAEHLDAFVAGEPRRGTSVGRRIRGRVPGLVWVFPGQGSQWPGMGHDLLGREAGFTEAMERCEAAIRREAGWSLRQELAAGESGSRLGEVDIVQPAIFAVQVALAAQWRAWGVEPDAVVGHSMGEVAAAHVAGTLDLDDAVRVICRRSRVVRRQASGGGGMAVVELPAEDVDKLLAPHAGRVTVAAWNGPTTTVIAGEPAALAAVGEAVEARGAFFQLVRVDYASHTEQMDPLRPALLEALAGVGARRPPAIHAPVRMISTLTGEALDRPCDAEYWVRNLREPVRFAQAVEALARAGHAFLEIAPHPVLAGAIGACLRAAGQPGEALPSLRRAEDGRAALLGSLGALHARGRAVDWRRLYPSTGPAAARVVALPFYPWRRERFWLDEGPSDNGGRARRGRHPLLGERFRAAGQPETLVWDGDVGAPLTPFLADHRVQGAIVLPGAACVEMALAAAREAFGPGAHAVEKLALKRALFLPEDGVRAVQVTLAPGALGESAFNLWSRPAGAGAASPGSAGAGPVPGAAGAWTLHASGAVRPARGQSPAPAHEALDAIGARCAEPVSADEFYAGLQRRGIQHGESFRGVAALALGPGEALARLQLTEAVSEQGALHVAHPALLDACFQALAAAMPAAVRAGRDAFLPVRIGSVHVHGDPVEAAWAHARFAVPAGADVAAEPAAVVEGDVHVLDAGGRVLIQIDGLAFQRLEGAGGAASGTDADLYEVRWELRPRPETPAPAAALAGPERWLVLLDRGGIGEALARRLEADGAHCDRVEIGAAFEVTGPDRYAVAPGRPDDLRRLLDEALRPALPPCRGIVSCWGAEAPARDDLALAAIEGTLEEQCLGALSLVQALAADGAGRRPPLWLVTRGAQPAGDALVPLAVAQAATAGLGRVVSIEHPEIRCIGVDLGAATPDEIDSLAAELRAPDGAASAPGGEDRVALRGGDRYVARLARCAPDAAPAGRRLVAPDAQAFALEIPTPGILDDFVLRAVARRPPGPGEVEIRVRTVGLNFRDVMIAMGLVPPSLEGMLDVGTECAGTVIAVGPGVDAVRPGDAVIAAGLTGFGSYATLPADAVLPKPPHLTFAEAATFPVAFATAHYSLYEIGRLRPGERVLIHAAAGGVGLAAVQLAQRIGAEVFATAGSPEKRDFLRGLGVAHVMDSRSLDFADEVLRATNGQGVDVVLHSLAGEFIPRGLATLRSGGRFLEIGKVDVLQNTPLGLRQLQRNLAFSVIDLSEFAAEPARFRQILREPLRYLAEGSVRPLPLRVFPVSELAEAFRHMAQARHIGKIVVSLEEDAVPVAPARPVAPAIRADATYLVTGGLGGVGLEIARWLVAGGARHLVLVGRRGAASPAAAAAVAELERAGAEVRVARADVSREAEVRGVLHDIRRSMPPLRGVVHAAMVLDDGILVRLTPAQFRAVMAPKIAGAWHLHRLTADPLTGGPLDFFALFSSGASVLGSPGQGNYVAANAFLDALAHHRRALGLPALTINWGLWAEVGAAAGPDIAARMSALGLVPMAPAEAMALWKRALGQGRAQVAAMAADWPRLAASFPSPLLSGLAGEPADRAGAARRPGAGALRVQLLAADPAVRESVLEAALVEHVARVLRCAASRVDAHQPLSGMGIDSLMAVELKNRIEADLAVVLPVVALLEGPSIAQLGARLLVELDDAGAGPAGPPIAPRPVDDDAIRAQVDALSDAEVESMLTRMLEGDASGTGPGAGVDEPPSLRA